MKRFGCLAPVLMVSCISAQTVLPKSQPAKLDARPVTLHVTFSRVVLLPLGVPGDGFPYQQLDCTVDGRRVLLLSHEVIRTVLAPGDYVARLSDNSKASKRGQVYDLSQDYVVELPDGTRRVYAVTGLGLPGTNP